MASSCPLGTLLLKTQTPCTDEAKGMLGRAWGWAAQATGPAEVLGDASISHET